MPRGKVVTVDMFIRNSVTFLRRKSEDAREVILGIISKEAMAPETSGGATLPDAPLTVVDPVAGNGKATKKGKKKSHKKGAGKASKATGENTDSEPAAEEQPEEVAE